MMQNCCHFHCYRWVKHVSRCIIGCRSLSIILVLITQREPSDCSSAPLKSIGPVRSSSGMKLLNSPFAVRMSPPPPRSLLLAALDMTGPSWKRSDRSRICTWSRVNCHLIGSTCPHHASSPVVGPPLVRRDSFSRRLPHQVTCGEVMSK